MKGNAMRCFVRNGPPFLLVDAGPSEDAGMGGLGDGEAEAVDARFGVESIRERSSKELPGGGGSSCLLLPAVATCREGSPAGSEGEAVSGNGGWGLRANSAKL